ncbi:MAG: ECF-type sigma factor [Planctomycetota bacterium]|jgi:RNA polymerase sigma factor (TIGR02999 family)
MARQSDATQILQELTSGSEAAVDRLLPLVYADLRRIAQKYLAEERPEHTLQATALVHEAYLRLIDQDRARYQDRAHFLAIAAQAMRRILIDHARKRGRQRRGGDRRRVTFDEALAISAEQPSMDLVDLDGALTKLAEEAPDKAKVVEMRFFGGLSNDEVAAAMNVSSRTVKRYWQYAQAWLYREMAGDGAADA